MNNLGLRSKSFRVLALVVLAVMGSQLPTLATIQLNPRQRIQNKNSPKPF